MPKWGLTATQRNLEPWDLDRGLLEPAKTITDPVQEVIYLNQLERLVLDSPPMQRLRRVNQLGTTHLVYPGATHSRFSHSLGALRGAQDLLDAVLDHMNTPSPKADLFDEWRQEDRKAKKANKKPDIELQRRIGEAVVLARLGALMHDMCHVPFGHTVEDDLGLLVPHDENLDRFKSLWEEIRAHDPLLDAALQGRLAAALFPLIMSKTRDGNPFVTGKDEAVAQAADEYPFVADIVGNTICADLLDYLNRDHLFTGLPIALGRRFISGFYVTKTSEPNYPQQMVIEITRNGRERQDVVSELFKYLRYRYELSERALYHHAKLATDSMLGVLLQYVYARAWIDAGREIGLPRVPKKGELTPEEYHSLRQNLHGRCSNALGAALETALSSVSTLAGENPVLAGFDSIPSTRPDERQSGLLQQALQSQRALRSVLSRSDKDGDIRQSVDDLKRVSGELIEHLRAAASPDGANSDIIIKAADVAELALAEHLQPLLMTEDRAASQLESLLRRRGDFGVLEQIQIESEGAPAGKMLSGIHELSTRLLNRRLYKPVAFSTRTARSLAPKMWEEYRDPSRRQQLVRQVAEALAAAGEPLDHPWQLAIWIPSPEMKLKPAGVLVDDDEQISSLQSRDESGSHRGMEIYDSHRALWSIQVFAGKPLSEGAREAVRNELLRLLGVTFEDGRAVDFEEQTEPTAERTGGKTFAFPPREDQKETGTATLPAAARGARDASEVETVAATLTSGTKGTRTTRQAPTRRGDAS